ncbi:unnamed protein product [Camellia sinensis]
MRKILETSQLKLYENNLHGKVPSGLYNISTIILLHTSYSQLSLFFEQLFTGTIPTSLTNASELEKIDFSENDFSGTMLRDLGKLLGLRFTSVYKSRLQGDLTFISSLTSCTSLQIIQVGNNLFRGSLSDSIANLSTYLSVMELWNNQIHGIIPSGIGNLLNPTLLSMATNNLASLIPSSISRLKKLQSLYLNQNKFTELPSSHGNSTSLITLYLHENSIHGSIPPSLGNCHSLLTLLLHKNNLNGSIPLEIMSLSSISTFLRLDHNIALTSSLPSEVGSLKNLGYMDVSYNRLSGPIPSTISNCLSLEWLLLEANSFEGEIRQSLSMLRGLRILDLSRNSSAISIVGNNMSYVEKSSCTPSIMHQFLRVSYPELLKATNGFLEANLIGVRSYASVYKGILDQVQMVVAVKVLNLHTRGASRSFMTECKVLRAIRHRNLLKILSVCSSVDFNGKWLHQVGVGNHGHPEEPRNLKLIQRLDSSIDVASALEYLHCGCESTILQGDLKPSNVLLDNEMMAHIGDFGLAKIISTISSDVAQDQSNSVVIRGTIGYVAPEYGMGDMDHLNLHNFVKNALPDGVMETMDPYMLLDHNTRRWIKRFMLSVLRIGIACSMESPRDRMEMGSVISELQ